MQAYCSRGTRRSRKKGLRGVEIDIQYWQKAQSSHLYPAAHNVRQIFFTLAYILTECFSLHQALTLHCMEQIFPYKECNYSTQNNEICNSNTDHVIDTTYKHCDICIISSCGSIFHLSHLGWYRCQSGKPQWKASAVTQQEGYKPASLPGLAQESYWVQEG